MACVKGINWGKFSIKNEQVTVQYDNKNVIEIPVDKIANSYVNKTDVVVELNNTNSGNHDFVNEIWFYCPNNEENKQNADYKSHSEQVNDEIRQAAKIGEIAGDSIVQLLDIQLQIPKGKYTLDFYKEKLKFHGATFNFIIDYKNVTKAFLLPLPDDTNTALMFGLDKPIKSGNTFYNYIIAQFRKSDAALIEIKLQEEERKAYNNLQPEYDGPKYEIFAILFKIIVGVNIIMPGKFKSSKDNSCMKANQKTNQGYLFPLQKSLVFINKPQIYIPLSEIKRIEIKNAKQSFDLIIITTQAPVTFSGIDKYEQEKLLEYFSDRKIKVINDRALDKQRKIEQQRQEREQFQDDDEESEDESYQVGEESSDDGDDDMSDDVE